MLWMERGIGEREGGSEGINECALGSLSVPTMRTGTKRETLVYFADMFFTHSGTQPNFSVQTLARGLGPCLTGGQRFRLVY